MCIPIKLFSSFGKTRIKSETPALDNVCRYTTYCFRTLMLKESLLQQGSDLDYTEESHSSDDQDNRITLKAHLWLQRSHTHNLVIFFSSLGNTDPGHRGITQEEQTGRWQQGGNDGNIYLQWTERHQGVMPPFLFLYLKSVKAIVFNCINTVWVQKMCRHSLFRNQLY